MDRHVSHKPTALFIPEEIRAVVNKMDLLSPESGRGCLQSSQTITSVGLETSGRMNSPSSIHFADITPIFKRADSSNLVTAMYPQTKDVRRCSLDGISPRPKNASGLNASQLNAALEVCTPRRNGKSTPPQGKTPPPTLFSSTHFSKENALSNPNRLRRVLLRSSQGFVLGAIAPTISTIVRAILPKLRESVLWGITAALICGSWEWFATNEGVQAMAREGKFGSVGALVFLAHSEYLEIEECCFVLEPNCCGTPLHKSKSTRHLETCSSCQPTTFNFENADSTKNLTAA
eukprot:gb/GEZN01006158.1/.p1 GENE.gb/GEZN01006158.1/~~gb/GEZN01006158.1/.p1  ORF type:complete len:290 (+),score=18.61 gb/GEZN01006158.1/:255-1124(+)